MRNTLTIRLSSCFLVGLALAATVAGYAQATGSEPEAYELLEPAGPEFWEQLSIEQQLAELERHDRESMVRQAYVFVDLTPIAEAGSGEPIRVSLRPFHDLAIEVDVVRENPPTRTYLNWHTPRGAKSWVSISTNSIAIPLRRGLEDQDRVVTLYVRHEGTSLSSHGVAGAPNVLCVEEVLFNLREPDSMNNSGGPPDHR